MRDQIQFINGSINGIADVTGTDLTKSDLNDQDEITCVLTSDANCAVPATATSNIETHGIS